MSDNPVFLVKNKLYISAGVIPYTIDTCGNYYFLFQRLTNEHRSWTYQDLGGTSQENDLSIKDVALRAFYEQTNETFCTEYLSKQLEDDRSIIYRIPDNRYMLYLIYVPLDLKETLDLSVFTIKQKSVLEWISYKSLMEVNDSEINHRITPSDFKNNLSLILAHSKMNIPYQKYSI